MSENFIYKIFSFFNLNHKNKIISYEYLIGIILAFGLWGYHLINTAFISQEISQKYDYKINGLANSYFNQIRDYTDHQWRNFRQSLPLISLFALIFLIFSNIVKKYYPQYKKHFYFTIGLSFGIYLHGIKIIFLLTILIINFNFTKIYNLIGRTIFTILTWTFAILIKIMSEIYGGFSFKTIKNIFPYLNFINEESELSWHLAFGLVMLRMISFNMEYKNVMINFNKKEEENKIDKSILHLKNCKECNVSGDNKFCLKYLQESPTKISDYNIINYLIYIFYPPVYFSGPTILFNSFIFQLNLNNNYQERLFTKEKIKYIIRFIIVFISFEIFNHLIYVNSYLTNYNNRFLYPEFNYYTYSLFCFFLLIFIWFKFTVIWRVARLWAWMDGFLIEENMNRCMYNNYSFEGFWRAWHRSFNIWLIRYIFIPLGGSKLKIVNIWVIFSFVALWHDLKLNLLIWGWFICLFLMPEILVKNYFEKKQFLNEKIWFRFMKYFFCAFYIVLMIIANLIGFGMGHEGLLEILINMFHMTSLFYFIKILVFLVPSVTVMFYVREQEALNNKINF